MEQYPFKKDPPFAFSPLDWILKLEASQHTLQHVKTEVQNCAFFSDFFTVTMKSWRPWKPASMLKFHSKGRKANGGSFLKGYCSILLCKYCSPHILGQLKKQL